MPTTAPIRLVHPDRTAEPMRFNFTKRDLERITCSDGQRWVYDTTAPGLALLTLPSQIKTFYLTKRIEGRYRKVKIGRFPGVSIEQARRQVHKLVGEIADGKNPAEARLQARTAPTFAETFTMYLHKWAMVRKRTWQADQAAYERHLKVWANRRPDQIKRHDVEALHLKIGKESPITANRVLALLSKVFNFAKIEPNPCRGVDRFEEKSRSRFMGTDELPHFIEAVDAEPNDTLRDFLKMLLFTAQRRRNVASMAWPELDLRRKVWTIPPEKFKTGATLEVPLVPAAMKILKARKQVNDSRETPSEYVFPSKRINAKNPYMDEPRGAFKRVCKAAGITGLTLHDIRRTVASMATAQAVPYPIVAAMLGHSAEGITAIYARPTPEAIREAFEKTVNAMLAAKAEKK